MSELVCQTCGQKFRGMTGREKNCPDCKARAASEKAARAQEREKERRVRQKEQIQARIAAKMKLVEKLQAEIIGMLEDL